MPWMQLNQFGGKCYTYDLWTDEEPSESSGKSPLDQATPEGVRLSKKKKSNNLALKANTDVCPKPLCDYGMGLVMEDGIGEF